MIDRKAYYFQNYDYYWLKYTLEYGAAEQVDKLLVGHSLARFGICDGQIPGLINLALLSQDYYYSMKIAQKAFDMIPTLRHVVLGCSYISPYMDLSRAHNPNEIARVTGVYGKYLHDWHHLEAPENTETDAAFEESCRKIYSPDYFCPARTRKDLAGMDWTEFMPEEERFRMAESRTAFHNRLLRHEETYEENTDLLNRMASMCEDRGATFTMVVFPSNRYYRNSLEPRLKEGFLAQTSSINRANAVRCIDLYDSGEFDSVADYIDTDHLNDQGAVKMTKVLQRLAFPQDAG